MCLTPPQKPLFERPCALLLVVKSALDSKSEKGVRRLNVTKDTAGAVCISSDLVLCSFREPRLRHDQQVHVIIHASVYTKVQLNSKGLKSSNARCWVACCYSDCCADLLAG